MSRGIRTSVKSYLNAQRTTLALDPLQENETINRNVTAPQHPVIEETTMESTTYGLSICDGNIPCFPILSSAAKNIASYGTTSAESSRHQVNLNSRVPSVTVPPFPRREDDILLSFNLKSFYRHELASATGNFLYSVFGEDGIDCFFKGYIDEHSFTPVTRGTGMAIAVKRLNQLRTLQMDITDMEWLTEVNRLGQLNHPNLLKVIGYCIEVDTRFLVFEYMPRGSLVNHLFRNASRFNILSWNLRLKIALGAARGLAFLHSEARVVYRDFKASKVLLDSSYNAKLFGYGPAMEQPELYRVLVDEIDMAEDLFDPYTAPEYLFNEEASITSESDVYSFGIFLLEILSSKRTFVKLRSSERGSGLLPLASGTTTIKCKVSQILDPRLVEECSQRAAVKTLELAIQCLSADRSRRPDMTRVVEILETLQSSGDEEASEISQNDSG